jgi:hypothetical protein
VDNELEQKKVCNSKAEIRQDFVRKFNERRTEETRRISIF